MALKTFKPYTKSTRGTVLIDRDGLWKGKPFKPLTSINNASRGRNNQGRITSRNHGGGHKQRYRHVDFYRRKFNMKGEGERLEYVGSAFVGFNLVPIILMLNSFTLGDYYV